MLAPWKYHHGRPLTAGITLIADILATGATLGEMREARAWLNGDEVPTGEGRPLPGTRVAERIDLLDAAEDD